MATQNYLLSANSGAMRGENPDAVRPRPLYEAIEAMENVRIVNADLPDLWNIIVEGDARALKRFATGWDIYPAPGQPCETLPENPPRPAWFAKPPEWQPRRDKPAGRPGPCF